METGSRGSASRRKGMPLKVRLNFGGKPIATKVPNGEGDMKEDNGDLVSGQSNPEDINDVQELPEGTVIVKPEPVQDIKIKFKGPEFKSSNKKNGGEPALLENLFCTACGRQVNPWKSDMIKKHRELNVLICRKCWNFLGSGEIAQDENGMDEQCRWCGEGGRLTICDHCPRAFCKGCIMRNFGRSSFTKITDSENWECFICDPTPLTDLHTHCKEVFRKVLGSSTSKRSSHKSPSKSPHVASSQSESMGRASVLSSLLSNFDIDAQSLVPLTNSLFEATNTFRNLIGSVLKVLGMSKETHTAGVPVEQFFSLMSESSSEEKTLKCCRVVKKGLKTYLTSFFKILDCHRDKIPKLAISGQKMLYLECNGEAGNVPSSQTNSVQTSFKNKSIRATSPEVIEITPRKRNKGGEHIQVFRIRHDATEKFKTLPPNKKLTSNNEDSISLSDDDSLDKDDVEIISDESESLSEKEVPMKESLDKCTDIISSDDSNDKDRSSSSMTKDKGSSSKHESSHEKGCAASITLQKKGCASNTPKKDADAKSSNNLEDLSTQEENLFAKLELIQELAEEFCKDSSPIKDGDDEDKSKPKEKDGYHSDSSQDLPQVFFGQPPPEDSPDVSVEPSKPKETFSKTQTSLKKDQTESSVAQQSCSDGIAEKSGQLEKSNLDSNKEKSKNIKPDVINDDVSSADLILSSDEETVPRKKHRRKKSKNGLASKSVKEQDSADDDSSDATSGKDKEISKRRMKTTPRKEGQKKQSQEKTANNTDSEDGDDDDDDDDDNDNDNDNEIDSDCKEKKSSKGKPKDTSDYQGTKKEQTNGSCKTEGESSSEEIDKQAESDRIKPKKKELGSSEEEERLEKQVTKMLNEPFSKKKNVVKKEEEVGKGSSRRKGVPKKMEKDKKGQKENIQDDSLDDEDDVEDEMQEEEDDDADVKLSEELQSKTGQMDGELENELAKAALLEDLSSDNPNEDEVDSSSESDIGAVKKRRASKSEEKDDDKEKDDDDDQEDDKEKDDDDDQEEAKDNSDSDFEPTSRKRFRSKLLDAKVSDSDSDKEIGKKKPGVKRKKKGSDDDDSFKDSEESEDYSEGIDSNEVSDDNSGSDGSKKKKKGKGKGKAKEKGKKRKRIKKMKSSSDEGEETVEGEEGTDSRKKIRKVMSERKLADDTKAAARAEEERRKRVTEKQQKFNGVETKDVGDGKAPITTKLVLEVDDKSKEPIIEVNKRLICKLKPHQVEAVQFMWECLFESLERSKEEEGSGCILAHCMGLGKTLSVVTFIHTLMRNAKKTKVKTCLVVSPLNTVLNWQNEWEIWLEDEDRLTVYEMASIKQNWARADALEEWHKDGGIMIMGYEMLRNLSQGSRVRNKKQKAIFAKTLLDPGPDIVVCDEGHILKNATSALSKAMAQIRTRRRIVLTGTPLQNNLIEYHCMVDFVKPNLLGTRKEFCNRFVNPIINGQHSDSTARDVKVMKNRAHILHELLAGCVQRRDYSSLTKFLPPKQEYVISVRLTELQIKLYEEYLSRAGQVDGQVTGKGARLFKDYQNLMKIWTHPWVLKMAEIRDESKMKFDDEDSFIDDDDYDDEKSFGSSDSSSDESLPKMSDGDESAGEGMSTNRGRRSRRLLGRNRSGSDKDEVVKEWKTRSRGGDNDLEMLVDEDPTPQAVSNEWWAQYIKEEDQNKMEHSGKLMLLFDILRMCEEIGDKVLIFSQSLLSLDIIEYFLDHVDSKFHAETANKADNELKEEFGKRWTKGEDYFRLDGSTSAQLRQHWAGIFNDPENLRARLFIISTRAGGLGINLVGANRVIIFDASWNPSHDVQSIFRVYRFGQEKPCYIYRFLAQGTMEEKIYERQVTKLSLSQRVVDEHQVERHFTSADLQELYAFRPDRLTEGKEKPTLLLPKDVLLAEILTAQRDWFVNLHEHDSLLENLVEQELTEDEKKAAWEEYENEKKGLRMNVAPMYGTAGFGSFLSQEFLLQTARNLREQNPEMPQKVLQDHLQRIIMMHIRQKQEEQRRLEIMQRQQESQYIQMQQQFAQLQQQYAQQMGQGMYPSFMSSGPSQRFSPSLYAHMAQPGLFFHQGMSSLTEQATPKAGNSTNPTNKGTSGATRNSNGAKVGSSPKDVIDLDESQ